VLAVAVTTACESKQESIPPCGPWSSVTSNPGNFDAGAPDVAALRQLDGSEGGRVDGALSDGDASDRRDAPSDRTSGDSSEGSPDGSEVRICGTNSCFARNITFEMRDLPGGLAVRSKRRTSVAWATP